MTAIRIVVVDDHPVVRDGLVGMLAGQPDLQVVAQAANGREALLQVERHDPDVVLMDLRMPEMDGVSAITQLRERGHRANVLVLTTYDRDEDIVPAIEAGATGYLLKDTPREELFRAVRAASRGESALTPAVAARLMGRMRNPAQDLSPREIEVLELAARGVVQASVLDRERVRVYAMSVERSGDPRERERAGALAVHQRGRGQRHGRGRESGTGHQSRSRNVVMARETSAGCSTWG